MGFGVVLIQRFRFYLLSVLSVCGRLTSREIRNKLYFLLMYNIKTQVWVYLLVFPTQVFYYFIETSACKHNQILLKLFTKLSADRNEGSGSRFI